MTYVPNPSFEREWLASTDALDLVAAIAEAAAPVAAQLAPKRLKHLANSIEASAGVVGGVATGRVSASDFKAHWYEFGTRRHGPEPYLRPAMEATTGRPVQGGKR